MEPEYRIARKSRAVECTDKSVARAWYVLHPRKIILQPVSLPCRQKETPPLEFLGAVVFPYYRHCTHRTLAKYRLACRTWGMLLVRTMHAAQYQACFQAYMSYAGYLSHFRAREVR